MAIKRYKPEHIATLLRRIEVGIANGKPTPQACNEAEIARRWNTNSKLIRSRGTKSLPC
jgi:hypothetical protein